MRIIFQRDNLAHTARLQKSMPFCFCTSCPTVFPVSLVLVSRSNNFLSLILLLKCKRENLQFVMYVVHVQAHIQNLLRANEYKSVNCRKPVDRSFDAYFVE